ALFGVLIDTGSRTSVFAGYLLGAVLMITAAAVGWRYAVAAERKSLESVATPLAVVEEDGMNEELVEMPSDDVAPEDMTPLQEKPDAVPVPHLLVPHLKETAILLDIDGTLLELMPTPREVWVPPGLRETLNGLLEKTAGALALVSGRSLNDIDLIFAPE